MKQIFAFLGCFLLVAVANAQNTKVTSIASAQITKLVDKASPTIAAPPVSPVPSPVNLLAKTVGGWDVVAPPSQPANTSSGKGGTLNGNWDVAKNSAN